MAARLQIVPFAAAMTPRRSTAWGRVLPTAEVGYAGAQLGVSFLAVRSRTAFTMLAGTM